MPPSNAFKPVWQRFLRSKLLAFLLQTIGCPLFFNCSSSAEVEISSNKNNGEDKSTEKHRHLLPLPLELHYELILFASRRTLVTLGSVNSSHRLSAAVALLAAQRLTAIRERLNSHQSAIQGQFIKALKPPQRRRIQAYGNVLFFAHIHHAEFYQWHGDANFLAIFDRHLLVLKSHQDGYTVLDTLQYDLQDYSDFGVFSKCLELRLWLNGSKAKSKPVFVAKFMLDSEFKSASDMLKYQSHFGVTYEARPPGSKLKPSRVRQVVVLLIIAMPRMVCVALSVAVPFLLIIAKHAVAAVLDL